MAPTGEAASPFLEELKDDAYAVFGWDQQTGIPQEGLLKELGIIP